MTLLLTGASFAACLFIGLLVCLELARRWGARQLERDPEGARHGTGTVEGAEFPRLGLIRVDGADQLLVDVRASFH